MKNNNFKDISFNYYSNTASYVKTILNILPEEKVSQEKKAIIIEIYNYLISNLSESELKDIIKVSEMFNEKLSVLSNQEIMTQVNFIYHSFLEKILFDSYNREMYFNIMNECVKVCSGYYQEYNDSNFYQANYNDIGNMYIR